MDDKLYFSADQISFAQMEMSMKMLAYMELNVAMKLHPEKFLSQQEINEFLEKSRSKTLQNLFIEFGHTPDIQQKP